MAKIYWKRACSRCYVSKSKRLSEYSYTNVTVPGKRAHFAHIMIVLVKML